MRAITVIPMQAGSVAVENIDEPAGHGAVLAETLAIGVCGTDGEILRGEYGWAPPGRQRLVIGHESVLRVVEAPPGASVEKGDLAVGIVRRPDPVPCPSCAAGDWDFCENGRYTERGIKELDGYGAEKVRVEAPFVVKVDRGLGVRGVLLEPASVVAKAWRVASAVGKRAPWTPRVVLVTGAGPIGLLAALIGVQRGLSVHVLDRVTDGPKPALVKKLGATYHASSVHEAGPPPDIIMECTGVDAVVFAAMDRVRRNGVVCLTGVSSGAHVMSSVNIGKLNRDIVLENNIVVGSVNANRADYEAGARALAAADRSWLDGLITRRVPLDSWRDAYERRPGDVKTIVSFAD